MIRTKRHTCGAFACVTIAVGVVAATAAAQTPAPTRSQEDPCATYLRSGEGTTERADRSTACVDALEAQVASLLDRELRRPTEQDAAQALTLAFGADAARPIDHTLLARPRETASQYLFRLHRLYQEVDHDDMKKDTALDNRVSALGERIHRLMDDLGLREPFAAALDTGLMIGDVGNSAFQQARSTTDKLPYGMIDWESKHYGEHGISDLSFGGRFGLFPTMALVNRSDEKPAADSKNPWPIRPLYQSAFQWDVGGRYNVHVSDSGELSLVAVRVGQAQLMDETQAVGTQATPVSTSLIRNGPGRTAWFGELGSQFRLFDNPLDTVHEDKSYLSPVFAIGVGIRRDGRFERREALQAFRAPEWRQVFHFMITLNKITDRRATGADPKTFAVALTVDHERPLRSGSRDRTVPAGTRIVLSANFDVLAKLSRAGATTAK